MLLSLDHAIEKYLKKTYDEREVSIDWHVCQIKASESGFILPSQSMMRLFTSDDELDGSNPIAVHQIFNKISNCL